jgi:hypothetical protein
MVFLGAEGKHTRFADFTRVLKWLQAAADKVMRRNQGFEKPEFLVAPPTNATPMAVGEVR